LESHLEGRDLAEVYDDIVIPALSRARSDCESMRVSREEARDLYRAARKTVEELAAGAIPSTASAAAPGDSLDGGAPVLGCAAADEADEVSLAMLRRLLGPYECGIEPVSAHALSGEVVTLAAERKSGVLLIAALSPGATEQVRHLCKRLRARCPEIRILVGRWGQNGAIDGDRELFLDAGAEAVGTSLRESCDQVLERARLL
jgi:hypothetical protein